MVNEACTIYEKSETESTNKNTKEAQVKPSTRDAQTQTVSVTFANVALQTNVSPIQDFNINSNLLRGVEKISSSQKK